MPSSGVIKEFFVSLGFGVDQASYNKFASGVATASKRVAILSAAVTAAAGAIFASVMKTAESLDNLSDISARVNVPVDKLEELGYIASQTDSSAEAVNASLERLSVVAGQAAQGIGRGAMMFKQLGLSAKNTDGSMKSTSVLLGEISDKIKGMSKSEQMGFLERLGIDRTMVNMLTGDVSKLTDEFRTMYQTAGVDANEAAQAASDFMDEWGKLKQISSMLWRSINVGFMMKFKDGIMRLRKTILENADKIKRIVTAVVSLIVRIAGGIVSAAMRIIKIVTKVADWFATLDDGTQTLILSLGALLLAWKTLGKGFLASPIGIIITALTALFFIVDDLLTYIEGGESYFNWGPWLPLIEEIIDKFKAFKDAAIEVFKRIWPVAEKAFNVIKGNVLDTVNTIIEVFGNVKDIITSVFNGDGKGAAEAFKSAVSNIFDYIEGTARRVFDFVLDLIGSVFGEDARKTVEDLGDAVFEFAGVVRTKIGEAFDYIRGSIDSFGIDFGVIWNGMKEIVTGVWEFIKTTIDSALKIITGIFQLFTAVFRGDWAGVKNAVKKIWDGLKEFFSGWIEASGKILNGIIDIIKGIFSGAYDRVCKIFDDLVAWFADLPARIGKAVAGIVDVLLKPFTSAFESIQKKWAGFKSWFGFGSDEEAAAAGSMSDEEAKARGRANLEKMGYVFDENGQVVTAPQLTPSPGTQAALAGNTNNDNSYTDNSTTTTKVDITVNGAGDPKAVANSTANAIENAGRNSQSKVKPLGRG
jgi:phage-related protein